MLKVSKVKNITVICSNMKNILVSGGNGFLGYHLIKELLGKGYAISVIDDLSTSQPSDILDKVDFNNVAVEKFETDEKYDYVIHLAARPSPEDYISSPVETMLSNSYGTKNMLDVALKSNAVFMYTSSSEVYGNASVIPTPESYYGYVNPNGIRSCYDESKRFSEALIMAYNRQLNLDVRIQRPFNVYGPRIREDGIYGRVIPRFIEQALSGRDVTIHGNGKQTRSFLYVDDWVEATVKFLFMERPDKNILNIGSDKEVSISYLADAIIRLTNSSSKTTYMPVREDDPVRRSADLNTTTKTLNWKPKTSLEDGLNKTIQWLRGN